MTFFAASGPILERPELTMFQPRTMQLEKMAIADNAPWLYSALSQLRDLEVSGQSIKGLGDLRIGDRTASRARMALSLIEMTELPVPVVSPVSGGAVSIVWSLGPKEVKFAFYPDGQAMYFFISDDEVVEDGAVDTSEPRKTSAPLQWMIEPQR